jgi:hypothetical protein
MFMLLLSSMKNLIETTDDLSSDWHQPGWLLAQARNNKWNNKK